MCQECAGAAYDQQVRDCLPTRSKNRNKWGDVLCKAQRRVCRLHLSTRSRSAELYPEILKKDEKEAVMAGMKGCQ